MKKGNNSAALQNKKMEEAYRMLFKAFNKKTWSINIHDCSFQGTRAEQLFSKAYHYETFEELTSHFNLTKYESSKNFECKLF